MPQWFTRLVDAAVRIRDTKMRWSDIRQAGNSPAVRATILIPLVGYLILLNKEALKLAEIDERFRFIVTETPWRLMLVYYGTCALGVASVLYLWKVPAEIRLYAQPQDFVAAELGYWNTPTHAKAFWELTDVDLQRLSPRQRTSFGETQLHTSMVKCKEVFKPSGNQRYLTELMALAWSARNMARSNVRVVCWTLYRIGFAFLIIPTVITFIEVTVYMLGFKP